MAYFHFMVFANTVMYTTDCDITCSHGGQYKLTRTVLRGTTLASAISTATTQQYLAKKFRLLAMWNLKAVFHP